MTIDPSGPNQRAAARAPTPVARRMLTLAGRLLAALLIGTATLLGPKPDPDEHWATPPRPTVVVVQQAEDPDEPLDSLQAEIQAALR